MKIPYLILLVVITIQSEAQVYVSKKSTGHKITFLLVAEDSVIMESYYFQMKTSPPVLTRNTNVYKIISKSEKIIKTNKFEIAKEEDRLFVENTTYLLNQNIDKCGDFSELDKRFGSLNSIDKLNICRNCYFLLHPTEEIREKIKKYPKKGIKIKEDINCRQEHSLFLKDLLKIIEQ